MAGPENLEPPLVKNGFRIAFWKVFSGGWRLDDARSVDVVWFEEPMTVTAAWLFRSGPDRLAGIEGDNYVFVYDVESTRDPADLAQRLAEIGRDSGRLESHLLEEWRTALADTPHGALLGELEHCGNKPAFKPDLTPVDTAIAAVVPFVLAFYYFAVTLIFRIERAQIGTPIPAEFGRIDPVSMESIARCRLRLVDFGRYFLTMNCSSNALVQALCAGTAGRLLLREQYARQVEMSASMECHLSNVSSLVQEREARRTGLAVRLLTLLAVPIGLFGALSGINLGTDYILRNPGGIVTNPVFWILWAMSIVTTIALIGASMLFGDLRQRLTRGR